MSNATARLERLLEDELGECCASDVEDRLTELDDLAAATPLGHVAGDVEALSTLGDDTRYRLTRVLVTAGEELCVCELAPILDVSDSAISHALTDLTEAGLLDRRKDGKWRYYRATDRAERLLGALDDSREVGE
jgi:DNA-binding transcriptional ArsR family regulator